MSAITQQNMVTHIIDKVVNDYVSRNQMFTVYQIWKDSSYLAKTSINYNSVRNRVEGTPIPGWSRRTGDHLTNLDDTIGKVGEAPQIYHHISMDISKYDKNFRLYQSNTIATKPTALTPLVLPITMEITKKVIDTPSGLFRFNVWLDGKLVPCNLRQVRGIGGKFVKNNPYEGRGVLDNGSEVMVRQDNDGKLYAVEN